MKLRFEWSPQRGSLNGKVIFLSASVPDPKRHHRFLKGPLPQASMLRLIDQRIDDAVQALLANVLDAGGRIVCGGHPSITRILADQANHWQLGEGVSGPPILIYQSEFFRNSQAPPGREAMVKAGTARVTWTPLNVAQVQERFDLRAELVGRWRQEQRDERKKREEEERLKEALLAPESRESRRGDRGQHNEALVEALLAMRLQMLLDCKPTAAICIGGMEGIDAEAKLYTDLVRSRLLYNANPKVQVLKSTYGAAAQLQSEFVEFLEEQPQQRAEPLPEALYKATILNAHEGLLRGEPQGRVSYDSGMRRFVERML